MNEPKGLTRRQLLLGGAAVVALGVTTPLPRALSTITRQLNLSEGVAQAQLSVKDLKNFPLSTLKAWDAAMDPDTSNSNKAHYQRDFQVEEKGNRYSVYAEITLDNDKTYRVTAMSDSKTKVKSVWVSDVTIPAKPILLGGSDLSELHKYYAEACRQNGCVVNGKTWPKVMINPTDTGFEIAVVFVDQKPTPNVSSDLKEGYPLLPLAYRKEKNAVVGFKSGHYKIEDDNKVAQKTTR